MAQGLSGVSWAHKDLHRTRKRSDMSSSRRWISELKANIRRCRSPRLQLHQNRGAFSHMEATSGSLRFDPFPSTRPSISMTPRRCYPIGSKFRFTTTIVGECHEQSVRWDLLRMNSVSCSPSFEYSRVFCGFTQFVSNGVHSSAYHA